MRRSAEALILANWQQRWNRLWRFNALKPALWLALLQAAMAGFALWRLDGLVAPTTLAALLIAVGAQAGLSSLLGALAKGREALYTAPVLPLLQISPAPSVAILGAEVWAALPGRLWSAILVSIALSPLLPPGARPWGIPLLAITALAAGALGQVTGLLTLVAGVRVAPRSLGAIMTAAMLLYTALAGYLLYLLLMGTSLSEVTLWLQRYKGWLFSGLCLLFGLPGLAMGLWLLIAPDKAGAAYRESWLALAELANDAARPRRSRLPALVGGAAGALQAKDWLQTARNRITLVRLLAWLVGLGALLLAGPALARVADGRREALLLGLGLGLAWFCMAELVGAIASAEGQRIALYVATGVRPSRFLAAKLLAGSPFALMTAIGPWLAAAGAGAPLAQQVRLAVIGGAMGIGMAAIIVGVAVVPIRLADDGAELSPEMAALLEQIPQGPWAWIGLLGSLLYAAVGIAWASGLLAGLALAGASPAGALAGLPLLALTLLAAGPLLALSAGYASLRRLIRHGGQ